MVTLTEEMRHYINRLNEAKVDKRQAQAVLAKISPTYAHIRNDDKLAEVRINKDAVKAIGMAMAFVAVAVGGVNVSMIGPMPAHAAQDLAHAIAQDIHNSPHADTNPYYSPDNWSVDVQPVTKASAAKPAGPEKAAPSASDELTAKIAARMEQRIAEMKALGVKVEHNHSERHDQVPDTYTADFGPWEGREGYANVPNRPTIVNLLVMEEEFAHALGSDELLYGKDPIHMLWEELRAKHYARLKVEEVFELDVDAHKQNDMTTQNYIDFARQMQKFTRQSYSDELIDAIRADAYATAERQYKEGKISVSNSGDRFKQYYAR